MAQSLASSLPAVNGEAATATADGPQATAAAEASAKAEAAARSAAAAAAAAGARLEPGQYATVADALEAAEAGSTIVLGAGHHSEVTFMFFPLGAGGRGAGEISGRFFLHKSAWVKG